MQIIYKITGFIFFWIIILAWFSYFTMIIIQKIDDFFTKKQKNMYFALKINKIRIKKAFKKTYWYADKIGCEYNVIKETQDAFLVDNGKGGKYYVYKQDAEIIK